MRIDIGPGGKIIGTKRVSGNGQVSGLTEYAGQEVLIILPGSASDISTSAEDFLAEVHRAVNEHMRLAFKQYKGLKDAYGSPGLATRDFMKTITPKSFHGLLAQADEWIREQAAMLERTVERTLTRGSGRQKRKKK